MMILDTNIVSEMMKKEPSPKVVHWLDQQESFEVYITTITIGEIIYGIKALIKGHRQNFLEIALNSLIKNAFKNRILSFNESSSRIYGTYMSYCKLIGKPSSILDGQIASIALDNDATLATRNTKDFMNANLELVNPFI